MVTDQITLEPLGTNVMLIRSLQLFSFILYYQNFVFQLIKAMRGNPKNIMVEKYPILSIPCQ